MFDFAWSEIALIAAVALIAIGPKDMPAAIRGVTDMIKKARRMAGEFQTHVDEMLREANLDEVRSHINDIRNFDVRGHLERAVDPDGSLRDTFANNPLEPTTAAVTSPSVEEIAVSEPAVVELERPVDVAPDPLSVQAPAFIPPNMLPPPEMCAEKQTEAEAEVPAFIPPAAVLQRRSHPSA
jgi:sec-independent protein translocase protein TatB